jgi:hypothetical protein
VGASPSGVTRRESHFDESLSEGVGRQVADHILIFRLHDVEYFVGSNQFALLLVAGYAEVGREERFYLISFLILIVMYNR